MNWKKQLKKGLLSASAVVRRDAHFQMEGPIFYGIRWRRYVDNREPKLFPERTYWIHSSIVCFYRGAGVQKNGKLILEKYRTKFSD